VEVNAEKEIRYKILPESYNRVEEQKDLNEVLLEYQHQQIM